MKSTTRVLSLGVPVLLAAAAIPAARAEFLEERTTRNLVPIQYGVGTTRLDGMGLRLAARDENNEINLLDYGDNPAGLLTDKDAWSVDVRLSHRERVERNPALSGFDFNGNTYSVLAGYRSSGIQAMAGGYDYVDSRIRQKDNSPTEYKDSQYRFLFNRMVRKFSFGFEFRYGDESEDLINPGRIYFIEHTAKNYKGIVGLSYPIHEYVTVAGLGNLRRASITGEASSDAHLDTFDWSRPSGGLEGQLFVNHPRVQGGASIGKTKGAGEETVAIGWSPLFVFNPSNNFVRFDKRVFTEKRDQSTFRTRWDFELVPDFATLSGSFNNESSDGEIRNIPTVVGSRSAISESFDASELAVGAGLLMLDQRLFAGAELRRQEQTYEDKDPLTGYKQDLSINGFNFGFEYLVLENLATRAGFGVRSEDRGDSRDPEETSGGTGSHGATTASFGLGLVPAGGILQLDAAYSADVSSGWDVDQNHFSLYARLLF